MTKARWYTEARKEGDENVVAWNPTILKYWGGNHDLSFVGNTMIAAGYVCGYSTKGEQHNYLADLESSIKKVEARAQNGDRDKKQMLFDLSAKMRVTRKIGHHEMIWRTANYPYSMISRDFEYVNPLPPSVRWRIIPKSTHELRDTDMQEVILPDTGPPPCRWHYA